MYHLRISSRITSARALGCSGDKSQKVEGRKEGKGGCRWGEGKREPVLLQSAYFILSPSSTPKHPFPIYKSDNRKNQTLKRQLPYIY